MNENKNTVYVLIRTCEHFRTDERAHYAKFNDIVSICKTVEQVVATANEFIGREHRCFVTYKTNGEFNENIVKKEDLFKVLTCSDNRIMDDYVFMRTFTKKGLRAQEWSLHVEVWPVFE